MRGAGRPTNGRPPFPHLATSRRPPYIFHARPGVEVTARNVVCGRIEIVEAAADAARRILVKQVVNAQREAEIVGEVWRLPPELHVDVEATAQLVAGGDSLRSRTLDVASGHRRTEARQIPVDNSDGFPLREGLVRASLLGPRD